MSRLWWFNPENDIALGHDIDNFTPPAAARTLSRAGALLPMWLGSPGDRVDCGGVNRALVKRLVDVYGLQVLPWNHDPADLTPSPWGWSRAARRHFEVHGFNASALPSDDTLHRYRQLSHRRTASHVHRLLAEHLSFDIFPPATEVSDLDTLERLILSRPAVLKTPWSSSGRGIEFTTPATAGAVLRRAAGIIRHQGSAMVETAATRAVDFAMLFHYINGEARYAGLSLFATSAGGQYGGNHVDTQASIENLICNHCDYTQLQTIRERLIDTLTAVIGHDYTGPLGVDMLADNRGTIHPVVEINFRYTMGFVALALAPHVAAPALFTLTTGTADAAAPVTHDGHLIAGTEILTSPGAGPAFILHIRP